jgi:8-oxo-(d)GTP phosphatase
VADAGAGVIRAAGAVVWRAAPAGPQVALVHRPKYDDWSYPKGKREPEEHILQTATREVEEETGLQVVLGRRLPPSEYEVNGRPKHVSYWAARCTGSVGFVPNHEVDELAWVDLPEVASRLSYLRDLELLDEFTAGPADTAPFVLLRHAEAGVGSQDATDLSRPLDERGAADAQFLAALLACFGPSRVLSSAAERCVATVRPYAEAAGLKVEVESALTVRRGSPPDEEASYRAARQVTELAKAGVPTLICAHRENLPQLANAARSALGAEPDSGSPLGKGEFIVLQSAQGALISAERHESASLS